MNALYQGMAVEEKTRQHTTDLEGERGRLLMASPCCSCPLWQLCAHCRCIGAESLQDLNGWLCVCVCVGGGGGAGLSLSDEVTHCCTVWAWAWCWPSCCNSLDCRVS